MSKKSIWPSNKSMIEKTQFKFSKEFMKEFELNTDLYHKLYAKLDDAVKGKKKFNNKDEYCILTCSYRMRYFSPQNVSEYVDFLMKALSKNLLELNVGDLENFTVEYAKRCLKDSTMIPLSQADDYFGNYIQANAQGLTLEDILISVDNERYSHCAISPTELQMRKDALKENDFKTVTDLKFEACMKNIVTAFEKVINNDSDYGYWDPTSRKLFETYVEKFVLFVLKFNAANLIKMFRYVAPTATFKAKNLNEDTNDDKEMVTECCCCNCFNKTTELTTTYQLPFDFNMKNIVLQDVHPTFEDTKAAIDFILKSRRSPIAIIIKTNADPNITTDPMYTPDTIARMFMHISKPYQYHELGRKVDCFDNEFYQKYFDIGFHTDMSWLDKITYGSNDLNSNWRKDAQGNNEFTPIVNTLDTLYHMFDTKDCNSKGELSNALIKLGCSMKSICDSYARGELDNWYMVKDILIVIGEIFTRTLLKLYALTKETVYIDTNMDYTMNPSLAYKESYALKYETDFVFMEDATVQTTSNQEGSNTVTAGSSTKTVTPSVDAGSSKDGNNEAATRNDESWLQKLINWVQQWMNNLTKNSTTQFENKVKENQKFFDQNKTAITAFENAIKSTDNRFTVNINDYVPFRSEDTKFETNTDKNVFNKYVKEKKVPTQDEYFKAFIGEKTLEGLNYESYVNHTGDKVTEWKKRIGNWCMYGKGVVQKGNEQQLTSEILDTLKKIINTSFNIYKKNINAEGQATKIYSDLAKTYKGEDAKPAGNLLKGYMTNINNLTLNTLARSYEDKYDLAFKIYKDCFNVYQSQQAEKNNTESKTDQTEQEKTQTQETPVSNETGANAGGAGEGSSSQT